jgi:iron complex transport system permease protein
MIPLTPRRLLLRLVPLGFLLIVVLAVSPSVGTHPLGLGEAWTALFDESAVTARTIAWDLRFPRALKAVVAGITLALAGAVYQTLFRNPLATPYTLGVASGASLGALIAYRLHWVTTYAGLSSVALSAFLGALAVLALVLGLARSTARVTGQTLLLARDHHWVFLFGHDDLSSPRSRT